MNRTVKVSVVLGLLLCAGVLARLAASQAPDAAKAGELQQLLARTLPVVEEMLGYRFPIAPTVKLVSRRELELIPGWEVKGFLRWRFPGLPEEERQRAYAVTHRLTCAATVARHVEGTATVVVCPDNAGAMAQWDESLAGAATDAYLQLALAHELVLLALEKRHRLLEKRHDPHSLDEFAVSQAVRGGRAQWVTRQVAARLGCVDVFPLLAERWRHVPETDLDPRVRTVLQTAMQQQHWAYTRGLAFFAALEGQGRADVEKAVLDRPPPDTRAVEEPVLYLQALRAFEGSLRDTLTRLERTPPVPGWPASQQAWSPALLRQVAVTLEVNGRVDQLVPHWRDGRSVVWAAPDNPSRLVALSVVRFDSPAAARAYYGLALDLQRQRDEWLLKGLGATATVASNRFRAVTLRGADEASRNDKTVQVPGSSRPIPLTHLLALCGSDVLTADWQGVEPDLAWVETVTAQVATPPAGSD